jgi:galactosamine-6-phosphate isomerase
MTFRTRIFEDHEQLSRFAAQSVVRRLRTRPDALICLAAGATPMRAYEFLSEHYQREPRLFDQLRIIKLDEWGGLPTLDPASCEAHLRHVLIDNLSLKDRYLGFQSDANDSEIECRRVAKWLQEQGPIDTCVLGLGLNGHVGFNEPATELQLHSHVARLSTESLKHAMIEQSQQAPTYGLTLGIGDLMHSRRVILLVSGPQKQTALKRLMSNRVSANFPASFLALHRNFHIYCDKAALGNE